MAERLSWADHRRLEDAQPGMVKLPDGSLIMSGQKPVEAKPGVLAGLRRLIQERLNPAPPVDRYWIPPEPVAAPVAPAPVAAVDPGAALPAYTNAWSEIEKKAAEQKRIADELGPVSKKIMESKPLIEGKWF